MGLETGTYINDLNTANPDGSVDAKSQGDDHIRLIKSTIKSTFPGMAGVAWREQAKSADYPLAATDNMSHIVVTAAATISGVAATVGSGFICMITNLHTAAITIPGSVSLKPNRSVFLLSNGSAFRHFRSGESMVLIDTQTASSSATLDFTTGIDATTYVAYKMVFEQIVQATDAVQLGLRVGNSGGVITTGIYNVVRYGYDTAGTEKTQFSNAGGRFLLTSTVAGSNSISGEVTILTPGNRIQITGGMNYYDKTSSAYTGVTVHGDVPLVGLDRFQVGSTSGNLTSGTVYLYGILP